MKNPATLSRYEFNSFTEALYARIQGHGSARVMLRDGRKVDIAWNEAEDDEDLEENYFFHRSNLQYLIWNHDGTSITSRDYDMMESVDF